MDEKEQLKLMLKKYLEIKVDTTEDYDGDTKVEVTLLFDDEEIYTSYSYVYKQKGDN